ncbi:hypothetical protein SAMN05216466_106124 [Paraburkholderia phenazinium]|uniref:Uncharacterized protein n=1 Tax=Paraburkholderia phenazinium TaxID=60549 RepID=A0A1G7YCE4_9BURK|nr:hypothetical protein [Paraburkholderia phenazinium]SDG93989.1 hypothetical protein SAMN05216466_106124 [Paraburkholderia phenazinium]
MLHSFQTILHVEVWAAIISIITAILVCGVARSVIASAVRRGVQIDAKTMGYMPIVWGAIKVGIYLYIAHVLPIQSLWLNMLLAVFLFGDAVMAFWKVFMLSLMVILKMRGTVQRARGGL